MGECVYECICGSPVFSRREGLREITFLTLTKSTHAEQPGPQFSPSLDRLLLNRKEANIYLSLQTG